MDSKQLQSMLEQRYEDEISRYRKTINLNPEEKAVDQALIKLLEALLFEMFGIEHEFDFENMY